MNTTHKRRGRRSLAAILAAMLMASVLAVVAGSPAQAANTSNEALVDTNDDGVPDAREFGGRDRYDTALSLAKNFATGRGGLGGVPTAFVASGHTLVDAVSVSGLAGFMDAPVMLTPSDSLHGGVADFIEDYGVDNIYVLGGSAAVADSVLEDMEALANEPTVSRIEGADRYATAAAIASKLGGSASWCGGDEVAALLVSGNAEELINAVIAGPIAHRLQLPMLMTAADELPTATTDFIESEDVEQIVIIGGTDSISEEVEAALSDAGVDNVDRIAGDTPAATSVALAELMTGDCEADLAPVATETVALVHRDALPDGVTAAPVLSSTYANNGDLVPILIVGDTLPASVRDYLRATPVEDEEGDKVNMAVVAIGGTAAVSDSVMEAALTAAASAGGLTVSISGSADDADAALAPGATFYLHFSDNVSPEGLDDKIRDIVDVNGAPARLGADTRDPAAVVHTSSATECNRKVVMVTLDDAATVELKAGDTVSVESSSIKLGDREDQRTVAPTSKTVPAATVDRDRPVVTIQAIVGLESFTVSVSDPSSSAISYVPDEAQAEAFDQDDIAFDADGDNEVPDFTESIDGTTSFTIDLDSNQVLERGDRITVKGNVFEDAAGNKNRPVSLTAVVPPENPKIVSVLMSNPNHSDHATVTVHDDVVSADASVSIAANADGAAAGAAGNDWSIVYDKASTWKKDKDLEIDVRVNSRDKIVSVRFNNGVPKYNDLVDALHDNSAFAAMFTATNGTTTDSANPCLGKDVNDEMPIGALDRQITSKLRGGATRVAIQVRFNGFVDAILDAQLFGDVFADTIERNTPAGGTAPDRGELFGSNGFNLDLATPSSDQDTELTVSGLDVPDNSIPTTMATYSLLTTNVKHLPMSRDLVTTVAGANVVVDDADTDEDEAADAVPAVAVGFTDDEDTDEDEKHNAASQHRIRVSSSVDAPEKPASDS
ncbi:cell wall-binding repeat-containing protein [Candidatus Poriferisodalis sp.]|uniref:cell wall-binding repeat-containing protein n=1 Tax=Candidatus Poriferisodalis sp. TaxID=3101277 RepID=UPI003B51A22E